MATIYKWGKYSVVEKFVQTSALSTFYIEDGLSVKIYASDNVDSATVTGTIGDLKVGQYFTIANGDAYITTSVGSTLLTARKCNKSDAKGGYIADVESENASAYPQDGAQGGYWYVYIGSETISKSMVLVTIGGVQKELTAIPAMVDGVQRELSSLYGAVDGVLRKIFGSDSPADPPSSLPSGFTELSYIQSSTTAYFNTNYVPTHNTRVVLKCKILEVTGNGWVFGSRVGSNNAQFDLFCETGGTSWRVGIGNKQTMISAGTFLGEYTFDISKDGAYVNGVKTDVTYGEFTGAQPIYLCGGNNNGTFFTGGHIIQQVEECQIYESGVLVHDYVPCMDASGVFGLYDKNTDTFGGSSGSGAFTGG